MSSKIFNVQCRNRSNCPNPDPDKIFKFEVPPGVVFRGPRRKTKEYEDEILVAICPWCDTYKKIHVRKEDPDDKVY